MALLEKSIQENPHPPAIAPHWPRSTSFTGMEQDAMKLYQDWNSRLPNDAAPHYELARLYESMGNDDQARAELTQYAK